MALWSDTHLSRPAPALARLSVHAGGLSCSRPMTDLLLRLILARIEELQSRVDADDVAAHLLKERIDELNGLLSRFSALVD